MVTKAKPKTLSPIKIQASPGGGYWYITTQATLRVSASTVNTLVGAAINACETLRAFKEFSAALYIDGVTQENLSLFLQHTVAEDIGGLLPRADRELIVRDLMNVEGEISAARLRRLECWPSMPESDDEDDDLGEDALTSDLTDEFCLKITKLAMPKLARHIVKWCNAYQKEQTIGRKVKTDQEVEAALAVLKRHGVVADLATVPSIVKWANSSNTDLDRVGAKSRAGTTHHNDEDDED